MAGQRCAICGDSIEPTLSLTLPPECIELMKNNADVDVSRIDGAVIIHICDDDTDIIERLVESGQSPLSRRDADYAEFTTRHRWKDAVGELLLPNIGTKNNSGRRSRIDVISQSRPLLLPRSLKVNPKYWTPSRTIKFSKQK